MVEIDKAGRIVVPKKMREAMRLRAGDKLSIQCNGSTLIMDAETKPRGLYEDRGWLVYDSGGPSVSNEDIRRVIEEQREERDLRNLGPG
jgi:AbrB family looped-hinge helix DNA binding protein